MSNNKNIIGTKEKYFTMGVRGNNETCQTVRTSWGPKKNNLQWEFVEQ